MSSKPEARLTSSLLARKGNAQPFCASDVFSLPPQTARNTDAGMGEQAVGRRLNLSGWLSSPATRRDQADNAPAQKPTPWDGDIPPPPNTETPKTTAATASISRVDAAAGLPANHSAVAMSPRDRVALTLRVDQERHMRLRVLAAQTKRSSQDILLAALDAYIDNAARGLDFCECLRPHDTCCKSKSRLG